MSNTGTGILVRLATRSMSVVPRNDEVGKDVTILDSAGKCNDK